MDTCFLFYRKIFLDNEISFSLTIPNKVPVLDKMSCDLGDEILLTFHIKFYHNIFFMLNSTFKDLLEFTLRINT